MNRNQKNTNSKNYKNKKFEKVKRSPQEDALKLRKEFNGQQAVELVMNGLTVALTTTVTSGIVNVNIGLSVAQIFAFSTRFQGFSEFRIVKVLAKVRGFASTATGIGCMWFAEDDSTTPSASISQEVPCRQFNFSNQVKPTTLAYVPRDPAQQTWTLVSSGSPTIGYFKVYTDSAVYGAPTAVTQLGMATFKYVVQMRGLI